jgi:hypothetical protein
LSIKAEKSVGRGGGNRALRYPRGKEIAFTTAKWILFTPVSQMKSKYPSPLGRVCFRNWIELTV